MSGRLIFIAAVLLSLMAITNSAFATTYTCSDCSTCTTLLSGGAVSGDVVQLTANVDASLECSQPPAFLMNCITWTSASNGVKFDLQGYYIKDLSNNCQFLFDLSNSAVRNIQVVNGLMDGGSSNTVFSNDLGNSTFRNFTFGARENKFYGDYNVFQNVSIVSGGYVTFGETFTPSAPSCVNSRWNVLNDSTLNTSSIYVFFLGGGSTCYGNSIYNNVLQSTSAGTSYCIRTSYQGDNNNNTIYNNNITGCTYGIYGATSQYHLIYNNFFNTTTNYYNSSSTLTNWFNTTNQTGPNKWGGPYIGGNYWATKTGTGFSQTCNDVNSDGFCDAAYQVGSYDYLPLATVGQIMTDVFPPNITVISPVNMTYGPDANLNVTVSENTSYCRYNLNGGSNTTLSNSSMTNWFYELESMTSGLKQLNVYCADVAGNLVLNNTVWFTVDATSPSVIVTSPVNMSYNADKVNVNVTTSEDSVSCISNLNGGANGSLSNSSMTNWYRELSPSESFYQLNVYCTDMYGNIGSNNTVYFTVDRTAPVITLYNPIAGLYNITILQLEVSSDEPVNTWWHQINSSSNVTFTPNTTVNFGADGTKLFTVYANDSAGNIGLAQVTVDIDTNPPDIFFVDPTPPDGSIVQNDWVFVNVTADEVITSCNLNWNFTETYNMTVVDGYYCYYNVTGLPDDDYVYWVTGVNLASNLNQSVQYNVTVHVNPPMITIFSPVNVTYGSTSVSLQVGANEPISLWEYDLNGTRIPFTPNTTITATEGLNHLVIYANDSLYENSTDVWFTVDTIPPNITISLPVNMSVYYSDENILFDVSTDSVAYSICISIDGNVTYSVCDYNTTTLSGYVTPLPEGFYNWTFRANDTIGNYEWQNVYFSVTKRPSDYIITLNEAGAGLGNFLDLITPPTTNFLLGIGVVVSIGMIIYGLASAFRGMFGKVFS